MRSAPWPDQASLPTWPPRAKVSGATNNADPTKLYSRTSTKALLDQPAGIQFLLSCEECGTTNRFTKNETLMEFGWIAYHCRECRKPLLFHVRAQSGRLHELPILQSLEASVLWTPRGSSSEQLSWSLKLDRRRMQEGAYAEFFCHGCARWQWSNVAGYHLLDVSCSNLACQRLITSIVSDETGRRRSLSGYLAGFNPDPSERQVVAIWLRHLARFRYDHNRRRAPVHDWQNPATTWQTGAGVCRDSAALLAGWLQSAGHDARMTTGLLLSPTNPGGGEPHAWVVLVDRATRKQYLLETAGETQESRMRTPPLAIHKAMEYAAQYQYLPDGCLSLGDRPIAPGEYVEGWHFSPDPLGP